MSEWDKTKQHIREEEILRLSKDGIKNQKDFDLMEHVKECDDCFHLYLSGIEENLLSLPVNFKENITGKIQKQNKIEMFLSGKKKFSFYGYCFRVGLACACSIILLFSFDLSQVSSIGSKLIERGKEETIVLQKKWSSFDNLFNWEVRYEKEKE